MDDDNKILIRYSYNQLAKRNLTCRYIFEDWKHLDKLTSQLKKGAKILDVGCGSGIPVDEYLLEKGFEVTGIDFSEEQIDLAKSKLPKGKFIVMDMEKMQFENNSFDAIISFYSLFHIPKINHPSLLNKLNRLLIPGGHIMITMGTKEYEGIEEEYEDIKLSWSQWGKGKNLEILRDSGFQIIYEDIHKSGGDEHLIVFAKKAINK